MTDTTTIEITADQKAQLDEHKQLDSESYKSVIARLIANYSKPDGDAIERYSEGVATSEDVQQLMNRIDDLESRLPAKVKRELR